MFVKATKIAPEPETVIHFQIVSESVLHIYFKQHAFAQQRYRICTHRMCNSVLSVTFSSTNSTCYVMHISCICKHDDLARLTYTVTHSNEPYQSLLYTRQPWNSPSNMSSADISKKTTSSLTQVTASHDSRLIRRRVCHSKAMLQLRQKTLTPSPPLPDS